MAKRFTDTEKWKRPWFRALPPAVRELWGYLLDNCDLAGIWVEDLAFANMVMGLAITEKDYLTHLAPKLIRIDSDKVFIPSFIEFQYEELSEDCKPHRAVIRRLRKHGIDPKTLTLSKEVPYPLDTLKDKDKEKDKEQDQEQDQEKEQDRGSAEGAEGETPPTPPASPAPEPAPPQPAAPVPDEYKSFAKNRELTKANLQLCFDAWRETLAHFRMGRSTLLEAEHLLITRAIQKHGAPAVRFALIGARLQKKSDTFDPAKFVNLERYLSRERFQDLMNAGVAEFHRTKPETEGVA
jgi:hypothetical protein